MPELKPHLKNLYRILPFKKSRMGYLRLDMNENVSGLPEDFLKEVMSEINPNFLATYPEYMALQEKIATFNHLKSENISLTNGSSPAIKYIFYAYVSPGDKILLTDPTYAMYPVYCRMFNAKPIVVDYKSDLTFPNEDFIGRISNEIKIAVVVNPNNPTGSVVEPNVLTEIIKKAADNDVFVIVDEAYFYFSTESVIELVRKYENLIVLRTFSKLFGIAGARLGYAVACPEIIENIRKVKPTYEINCLAVLLGEKILGNPNIIQNLLKDTKEGKEYLIQKLSEVGIEYKESCANFVLIKCNERVDEIIKKLAEKNILVSGRFKQDFLKDYIRVTIGNRMIMDRFWDFFIKIWQDINE